MLATGSSLVLAYNALCERGGIRTTTHVAAVIASEQGIDYVQQHMPHQTTTVWGSGGRRGTDFAFVHRAGIGDAGDLAYGEKLLIGSNRHQ